MITAIKLFFDTPLLPSLGVAGILGIFFIIIGVLAPVWLPVDKRNVIWIGVMLLIASIATSWVFHQGETHAIMKIAAKDDAAIAKVKKAIERVVACNGGVDWDVTTGKCKSADR